METLQEAVIEAFNYLEVTFEPKWTTGLGAKSNLVAAFSQKALPKHEFLGYAGSDGLRHAFGRAIKNHNKPKNLTWEKWLLYNINKFQCYKCEYVFSLDKKVTGITYLCKNCDSTKTKYNNDSKRDFVYTVLLKSNGCVDCGIKDPVVLEFDHRDPTTKLFNIGEGYGKTSGSYQD